MVVADVKPLVFPILVGINELVLQVQLPVPLRTWIPAPPTCSARVLSTQIQLHPKELTK
jgi:hypothetical protein